MRHSLDSTSDASLARLLGTSPAMVALRAQLQQLGRFDAIGQAAVWWCGRTNWPRHCPRARHDGHDVLATAGGGPPLLEPREPAS